MEPLQMLTWALASDDPVVAGDAARLLGELGRADAVPALMNYVKEGRYHYKSAGNWALAALGDAMDPALRQQACAALGQVVATPNVHDDWYWYGCRGVRASAAIALLTLGDASGAAFLRELADKQHDVFLRWFAPAILRLKGTLPEIAELQSRLTVGAILEREGKGTRATEPGLLTMKAEALGILGGPEACTGLLELMIFHSRYVRGRAALSLLETSSAPEHIAAVEGLADNDPTDFVRIKASLALALKGHSQRVRVIVRAAGSAKDDFDRAVALEALGILGRRQDAPLVRRHLKHKDPYVRQCALEALERIDAAAAAEAAKKMLRDPSSRVRLQAAKALAGKPQQAPAIKRTRKPQVSKLRRARRHALAGGKR